MRAVDQDLLLWPVAGSGLALSGLCQSSKHTPRYLLAHAEVDEDEPRATGAGILAMSSVESVVPSQICDDMSDAALAVVSEQK